MKLPTSWPWMSPTTPLPMRLISIDWPISARPRTTLNTASAAGRMAQSQLRPCAVISVSTAVCSEPTRTPFIAAASTAQTAATATAVQRRAR